MKEPFEFPHISSTTRKQSSTANRRFCFRLTQLKHFKAVDWLSAASLVVNVEQSGLFLPPREFDVWHVCDAIPGLRQQFGQSVLSSVVIECLISPPGGADTNGPNRPRDCYLRVSLSVESISRFQSGAKRAEGGGVTSHLGVRKKIQPTR